MNPTTYFACLLSAVFGAEEPQVIPLWEAGPPGFESRRDEPEEAKDYWVRNVHNPSLTVFLPPKEKATGTAVVVCPGGGHRLLVDNAEGVEPARYLNDLGVAAFVLKHRLPRQEGSPYDLDVHPREDGLRAMRLVRSRAAEWGIDPGRIGFMGFSAGGEVASMVAFGPTAGAPDAADPVDRADARPDFLIEIYPGPLGIPEALPANPPPAFLLVANDDGAARNVVALLEKYRDARAPVEAHFFARGGHGFNMGNRSKLASVRKWPERLADWMADGGLLGPPRPDDQP
ncbi:MAG TPA: alpha/beta hydrolase [Planctomycetaceae bacterium]